HRLKQRRVTGHRPLLPAEQPGDQLPLTVGRMLGGHDTTEAQPPHHLADLNRRDIARGVSDPAAVRWIERDPLRAHQRLALGDVRDRFVDQLERPGPYPPTRTLTQHKAAIALAHTASKPSQPRTGVKAPASRGQHADNLPARGTRPIA